jgi:hypothetical protein
MELQLEELEAAATEDELAAEQAASRTGNAQSFQRKRPSRKPFPEHLPRERVVIPVPACCPCCGSAKLSKLGEDITETLEVIPRQWKVIQTVREKFSCRNCETIALEAVKRIDALFDIERSINGLSAGERLCVRREQSAALLADLEDWLRKERAGLSWSASVIKPINHMLKRWERFAGFLDDGRICLGNNAAERALRGFALGRKSWLFAGSERGAGGAAAVTTLIMTAKLNDIDPLAWLADALARIAEMPHSRLPELLPWEWKKSSLAKAA